MRTTARAATASRRGTTSGWGWRSRCWSSGSPLSNTLDGWRGSLAIAGGALVALAIMGAQVARFKRLNGMWVSGLIAGRTRG